MYCLTRNDMKFGEYFIPAKTKARVINKPEYREANIPGLHLNISISLSDMILKQRKSVPINEVEINNELENINFGGTNSQMVGISIRTDSTQVSMDAGDKFYSDTTLYEFQVRKVLMLEVIPDEIKKAPYENKYLLQSLLEYLENQFAEWVSKNCEFKILTDEDIENGEGFDDAEPGDTILSDNGLEQFENKRLEYQSVLEKIGFTYDFKGGLVWN